MASYTRVVCICHPSDPARATLTRLGPCLLYFSHQETYGVTSVFLAFQRKISSTNTSNCDRVCLRILARGSSGPHAPAIVVLETLLRRRAQRFALRISRSPECRKLHGLKRPARR